MEIVVHRGLEIVYRRIVRGISVHKVQLELRFDPTWIYHAIVWKFDSAFFRIFVIFSICITYAVVAPNVRSATAAALKYTIFKGSKRRSFPLLCGKIWVTRWNFEKDVPAMKNW